MQIGSVLAVYFLFFVFTAFIMLPFGVKTADEAGEALVPGQATSAPHRFNLPRHLGRAALVAAGLFALYYLNWSQGWITLDDLDITRWLG